MRFVKNGAVKNLHDKGPIINSQLLRLKAARGFGSRFSQVGPTKVEGINLSFKNAQTVFLKVCRIS